MTELFGQPNLSQLAEAVVEATGEQLRVSLPGEIVSVASDLSTATVQPAVSRYDSDADPAIPDVPLLFPRWGSGQMTWPVEAGDPCLLVFGDRSLEEWQSGGGRQASPADPRTHDLTDAVAIPVGLGGAAAGRAGDVSIQVTSGGNTAEVRVQGNGRIAIGNASGELVDLVSQLCSVLEGALILSVDAGSHQGQLLPGAKDAVEAIRSKLDAIKGSI